MNIGWVFVHGWTGDSCRTFVRIKFLRVVLRRVDVGIDVVNCAFYWSFSILGWGWRGWAGEEGGYGKPKHNIRALSLHSSQLSTRSGKFWQHCSLLALVLLAAIVCWLLLNISDSEPPHHTSCSHLIWSSNKGNVTRDTWSAFRIQPFNPSHVDMIIMRQ